MCMVRARSRLHAQCCSQHTLTCLEFGIFSASVIVPSCGRPCVSTDVKPTAPFVLLSQTSQCWCRRRTYMTYGDMECSLGVD